MNILIQTILKSQTILDDDIKEQILNAADEFKSAKADKEGK